MVTARRWLVLCLKRGGHATSRSTNIIRSRGCPSQADIGYARYGCPCGDLDRSFSLDLDYSWPHGLSQGCSGVSAPSDNESTTPTEAPGETPAPTMSVVPETPGTGDGLAEGYEYIGCFADRSPISKRDMALRSKRSFDNNGPDVCAAHCMEEPGSAFFGLQNSDL